jgi:hypothetical protein
MESSWYKRQPADVQSKVSWKLYELVPNSCTCKYNLSVEDENIKEVTTIDIGQFLPESACKTLVATLGTSRIDYGNAILYGINNNVLSKLQRIQNTAARLITRKRKYEHITPELMALHWLPIKYRCEHKLLLYTFKVLTERAPVYFQELLTIHVPTRSLRSENSMLLSQTLL